MDSHARSQATLVRPGGDVDGAPICPACGDEGVFVPQLVALADASDECCESAEYELGGSLEAIWCDEWGCYECAITWWTTRAG